MKVKLKSRIEKKHDIKFLIDDLRNAKKSEG